MNDSFSKFDLTGKKALITGAAGLMGKEHALALLESGASVILTDININALESIHNSLSEIYNSDRIISREMNVTSHADVVNVSKDLELLGWSVDILINNAAIDPKVKNLNGIDNSSRLENFSLEQWDLQLAVGLTGAFLCSQIFGSRMAKSGRGGVILNISSDLSVISPDQRLYRINTLPNEMQPVKPVTYSVIKTALIGLTRYLATYWAEEGVRVNALSPGGIYTGQNELFVKKISSLIPLGRMANNDEYRSTVQFMCSDASAYMTGQNIVIDGGRSVW
jgi:NAD(P)-dependent dehydrogenase (short-subunit alcohol dehydrogenase family)